MCIHMHFVIYFSCLWRHTHCAACAWIEILRSVCVAALDAFFLNGRLERSKGNSWRGDNCRVLPGGHAAAVPTPRQELRFEAAVTAYVYNSHFLFSLKCKSCDDV